MSVNLNFLIGDSKTLVAEKVLRTSRGALAVQWNDGTISYKTHVDNMIKEGKLTVNKDNPAEATFDPITGNVTKDGIRFFQNQGAKVTFSEV